MTHFSRIILCLVSLVAFSLSAADTPSNASGTLTVNGTTTPLRYAYAFRDAEGSTRVLITSNALEPATLAAEAALSWRRGKSTLRDLVSSGKAAAIELFVKDERMETVIVFDRGFSEPTACSGDNSYWYEPYRMSEGWIGGRSRTKEPQEFFDTHWEYDVAYFAPVGAKGFDVPPADALAAQRKEIDAREKPRIVAPGGGEEGAMYLSFYRNAEAVNTKAMLEQMTASMKKTLAAEMQVDVSPETLAVLAMAWSTPPGKVEIVGGVRDPEGTLLELRKSMSGRTRFGSARIVRDGGAWKVAEQTWW